MRLNKFLANAGIASRRACDDIIAAGRVKVNNVIVREMGVQVEPGVDVVQFDGVLVGSAIVNSDSPRLYYAVYKPAEYVSTTTARFGEKIVTSLVPFAGRLYPVGRLDKDSEGLMILTNDGDFAYQMTHPKFEVEKKYQVLVRGRVEEEVLEALRGGIDLGDEKAAPCDVRLIREERPGEVWLEFVLHEGKKRQIRRMCGVVHLFVIKLVRVQMGKLQLGNLGEGKFKAIMREDIL